MSRLVQLLMASVRYDRGELPSQVCLAYAYVNCRLSERVPKGKRTPLHPWAGVLTSISIPWDIQAPGTCGQIQPCNALKLADVPDMGVSETIFLLPDIEAD